MMSHSTSLSVTTGVAPTEPPPPPPSRPAPSGVSHVTPQSSPPQRPVLVVSGGAGGAIADGEGAGAAGAGGVGSGGAGGVGVEVTPVENTAASTRRPCPVSPPGFPSDPQFPPRSSLRPVVAEPGGVPAGGTGGLGGVGGGGAGFGGAGAGGTGTVPPTPRTVRFLTPAVAVAVGAAAVAVAAVAAAAGGGGGAGAVLVAAVGESRRGATAVAGESRGGVMTSAVGAVAFAAGESRGGVTSAAACAVAVAAGESRGGVTTAPGEGRAGFPLAVADAVTNTAGECRGGATGAVGGAGTVAADARGGGAATLSASQWIRRSPLSRAVSPEPCRSHYCADESTLTLFHDSLSDYLRASRPVVSRVLSTLVTHPIAPLSSVSALVTTIAGFASSHRLDYAAYLVSGPARSPSSGGAPVFSQEVLEDWQFELGFLAVTVPHLCAFLLAPEGNPDALGIPIPCTDVEAVSGPWVSYSIAPEEAEMASHRSTGTYFDAVPPPGMNIVSG
ncbi:unnamed protein product [Closterium sp. NIES-54]